MDILKKQEGFTGEKLIVLPRNFLQESSRHPLINPIYITDIGFFPDAQYHYRERPEGSEQNILIYCSNGEGYIYINDKKRIIKKDTILVIPKGIPHIYGSDEKNPWTIYWLHFLGSNAENYYGGQSSDNIIAPVSIDKISKIKFLLEDIFSFMEKGYTLDVMIYISQVLANLLGVFFFMNNDYKLGLKQDIIRIEESIHFMMKHLSLPLTLNQLAIQANLSPTHYSYLFKKKTGFSPIDYFIRLKIQRACQYLDITNLKINEISRKLGFQDPYYFSRTFHKVIQQSPSLYRDVKKG